MVPSEDNLSVEQILAANQPYYNHRLHWEALESILPHVLRPEEEVVGVFKKSLEPSSFCYSTWLIISDKRVIVVTPHLGGWKAKTIPHEDIKQVEERCIDTWSGEPVSETVWTEDTRARLSSLGLLILSVIFIPPVSMVTRILPAELFDIRWR